MAEVETNVTLKRIKGIADQIVEHSHPQKIILFGSYAYGTATVDSDVDLLVMIDTENLSMSQRKLLQPLTIPFLWTLSYSRPPTGMLL